MSRSFTWFTIWSILKTQYVLRNGCQKLVNILYVNLLKLFVFVRILEYGRMGKKKMLSSFHIHFKLAECFQRVSGQYTQFNYHIKSSESAKNRPVLDDY